MIIKKFKRLYRYLFRSQPKVKLDFKVDMERHGNDYGGWEIVVDSLNENSIVYSIGIGEDISFDNSIIAKYKCKIYAFDPTPRVGKWLAQQRIHENFIFTDVGLSDVDGYLTFYVPTISGNISHTAFNVGGTRAIEVKCNRLETLLKQNNNSSIDLLKIDIEGFEYQVITDMIESEIFPNQLLIEFHHFFKNVGNTKTEQAVEYLKVNGYALINISDSYCEYSFIRI